MLNSNIKYIVTIGGMGERMKCLSPVDKHLLYYKDKRIIEWILSILPSAQVIGQEKTNSRKQTLLSIKDYKNVCIVDCDIIPFGLDKISFEEDTVLCFLSNKTKYSSVIIHNGKVINASEENILTNTKCSGVYFVRSVKDLLDKMINENSLCEAMIGSKAIFENTFVRMGDPEDYMESL